MAYQKTTRPTHPCSNTDCANEVRPRRPSTTGDHWCSNRECQAKKQKQLRARRRRENLSSGPVEDEKVSLVRAALHIPRRVCTQCGLENAVSGFAHRAGPGLNGICQGTGGQGRAAGQFWLDLIHPELAPGYEA